MKWIRIPKENAQKPSAGTYKDWKPIIAKEGGYQCVYCAIGEASFGGTRNFHVEHYKPRSIYRELENEISNLFYACPVCNTFKGDSFPAEPVEDHSVGCYPNPSTTDYNELFDIDLSLGIVGGKYTASRYLVVRLHLNRPQLVLERRIVHTYARVKNARTYLRELLNRVILTENKQKAVSLLARACFLLDDIAELNAQERKTR